MFFGKEVKILLKGVAKEEYSNLQTSSDKELNSVSNSVERVKEVLHQNPQHGDPIKKKLIPAVFLQIGIQNLYRVELANFWRLLYTLESNEKEIFVFILKICDHEEYNKLFGYKNS